MCRKTAKGYNQEKILSACLKKKLSIETNYFQRDINECQNNTSLPSSYSVLNDKISFSVLLWFPVESVSAEFE
jgi:hypothetical protein